MQRVALRRLAAASLVAAAAAAASSCRAHPDDASPPLPQRIDLIVRNDGFLDANIYATFSNGARGARLGMVPGHSAMRLSVRMSDLHPGNILVLRVHGIGATGDWLSQAVVVDPPDYAELTLIADANSKYEFSNLYPRLRGTAALPIH
jgi:hypothetical protein